MLDFLGLVNVVFTSRQGYQLRSSKIMPGRSVRYTPGEKRAKVRGEASEARSSSSGTCRRPPRLHPESSGELGEPVWQRDRADAG